MITSIILSIALVGLVLFALLILGIRNTINAVQLKRHRSKEAGVADLLNYAAVVADGIIACKSGALMTAWIYSGPDADNIEAVERERASALINAALLGLGDGFMVHIDAIRKSTPQYIAHGLSHFPDPVSAAVDEERRRFFEEHSIMYEGFFVLTLTWYPPMLAQARFVELMFDDDTKPTGKEERFSKLLQQFQKDAQALENRLSTVLKLTRLQAVTRVQENGQVITYDEFLSYLQMCITGLVQPMVLPANPVYLDGLLGGQELHGGVVPKIGKNFIQIVAIEGFPLESYPGMLSALTDLDLEYRWSNRFIFLDAHTAVSHMDKYHKKWRQKQRGIFDVIFHTNGPPDHDAMNMTQDAEIAISSVKSGLTAAGYYTSVVVLMSEDRAKVENAAQKIQKLVFNLGFTARIETINTMDAFFGSLPGHGVENVRRPILNTMNLADLIPTSTIWTGDDFAPCPLYPPNSPALMYCVTNGYSPFRLNLHVRDLGHTFIFGGTGAGKSTALAILAMQLRRYANMSIFAFDKGMSMYATVKACQGTHYIIGAENLSFCPLQYLETREDQAWALEWLDQILLLNNVQTSPGMRNEMSSTLVSMAQNDTRCLSDFMTLVQNNQIREALHSYSLEGVMGTLLDASSDQLSLEQSNFVVFELEELLGMGERWVIPVMLYLFRRILCSLQGQPAAILIDEAWIMLANPVCRDMIKEFLKVLRKRNCIIIMATQSLSDASNSAIFDVIVESTATKIYLANPYAKNTETMAIYRRMGLNERQIEIIAAAQPKRDYYLTCEKGSRLFSFALGPLALAFAGATDKETVAHIQDLERLHGSDWVQAWLSERKLSLE